MAAAADSNATIICREEISPAHREQLADKLRAITGLSVEFDSHGALRVTSSHAGNGSQTARNLITKALAGTNVMIVEDASGRQDVVFSRVVPGKLKHHGTQLPKTFVVLIDFADFDQLMGDEAALEAFDVGWAFLHEVDHVVNDLADADRLNETGECEDHINAMRRECGLPLRVEYFYTYFPAVEQSDFRTRFVRLPFEQADTTGKKRRFWLMWDATIVGGISAQIATAR
jgi:hypothetical protein